MFVVAVVIIALLRTLSIGTGGTLDTKLKTSALNLAKSQLEHVKSQSYVNATGSLSNIYGLIPANAMSDTKNFSVSGSVQKENSSCNGSGCLQKITVNVSYSNGAKTVQVIGYKNPDQNAVTTYNNLTNTGAAYDRSYSQCDHETYKYPHNVIEYFNTPACGCVHYGNSYLGAATTTIYQKVSSVNGDYWLTEKTDKVTALDWDWNTQLYTFTISQVRSSVKDIQVTWRGHGSKAGTWCSDLITDIKVNNYSANPQAWTLLTSQSGKDSDVTWSFNLSDFGNPQNYIDASTGNLSILVEAQTGSSICANHAWGLWTDYISLNVTSVSAPIALAPQDDGTNPLPYLAEAPFNNPLLARDTGVSYQYNISPSDISVEKQ